MTPNIRKSRYAPGDRVELYPEPTHEGPHADDQYVERRYARVLDVHVHPNNDEYVLGYTVAEHEPMHDPEQPEAIEVHRIKPGAIARLAPFAPTN
jgi:hypothetical protein